jgi:hypothetical protein
VRKTATISICASKTVDRDRARGTTCPERLGRDAQRLIAEGDDGLVWPEFGNAEDATIA